MDEKLKIGKEIVRKLKGLPLAAKLVGSSLCYEPDVRAWIKFLDSLLRKQNKHEDDVMPVLRWSYSRLPSHLKQCFSYCALFPKDHEFDEKELVKIWMAHDIIPKEAQGGEEPEDIGAQYFKELVNTSFFQCINGNYVMHDMIHDLALLVSDEDFVTLSRQHSSPPQMDNVRHVRIIDDDDYAKNLRLCKSKRILTVHTVQNSTTPAFPHLGEDVLAFVFKQWKSIRMLVLYNRGITEIPDCINELKHLRYLDVSNTEVTSLPDSLFELYNLQTLVVPNKVDLPKKARNLKNLRHLRGAILTSCKVIAQLTSLQELTAVTVCEGDCISELQHLRGLRGTLKIRGLDNVTSSEDAAQAGMQEKEFIDSLFLLFGKDTVSTEECGISRDVLEALNCPRNLKYIQIYDYNGDKFPGWLTNAANSMRFLSSLEIDSCDKVELLQLDAFVSLKRLYVGFCSNLQRIRLAEEVAATIKYLSIFGCHDLTKMEIESLPSLREFRISDCYKLLSFPPCLVKIQELIVTDCNLRFLMFTLHGFKSLVNLKILRCPMLKRFVIVEEGSTSCLSSSSSLSIRELTLPDDEYIDIYNLTHKFEHHAEGRLVLNRR